jgi:hypothetical protein
MTPPLFVMYTALFEVDKIPLEKLVGSSEIRKERD